MSDLAQRNAKATQQGLEGLEARVRTLETQVQTLSGQNQTLINLVSKLQRTNTLALAKLRGTGATNGHIG